MKKTYTYCNVLPANYQTPYWYISDFGVEPGDIVVLSIRSTNNLKAALVLDVQECTEENAPYPPQYTKHLLRLFGDDEDSDLNAQKRKVEKEKAERFKSSEQLEKLEIKEALYKHGVDKEKRDASSALLKGLLESLKTKNETISTILTDLSGGIKLSEDGKTVIGFDEKKAKGKIKVIIPSGVERINDNALLYIKIESIFLPKELKYIGKHTLLDRYDYPKEVNSIEVEEGNENYYCDGIGFYSIKSNNKKVLDYIIDNSIIEYNTPEDVVSFADNSFTRCHQLSSIQLCEGFEEFNEYSLSNTTQVKEVFIPKNVKKLIPRDIDAAYVTWNTVSYRIDEENEYLFKDEDSIYEVLEDGTYRLITNQYDGKGRLLILDGTSIIGTKAFRKHKSFYDLVIPDSVRIIEELAFSETFIRTLRIPKTVKRIEKNAFSGCNSLDDVQLSSEIEYVDPEAFSNCYSLKKIKTEGKKKTVFTYENGIVGRNDKKTDSLVALENTTKNAISKSILSKSPVNKNPKFDKYASDLIKEIKEISTRDKDNINDTIRYDDENRIIHITTAFSQRNSSKDIVKKRVACAESLKNGDSVRIKMIENKWEVFSQDGQSIGELNWLIGRLSVPIINDIEIISATVSNLLPKSKANPGTRYAKGSVNLQIVERNDASTLSEQDKKTKQQFAYSIFDDEAILCRWIGGASVKKITVPSFIEGKPVLALYPGLFEGDSWTELHSPGEYMGFDYHLEELLIPEGVKRLEANSINHMRIKKVIIPKSVEYIDPLVFSNIDGNYRDLYLSKETVFVTPKDSFADKFLRGYLADSYDVKMLNVINEDNEENNAVAKLLSYLDVEPVESGLKVKFKSEYELKGFSDKIITLPGIINNKPVIEFDIFTLPMCVEKLIIPETLMNLDGINSSRLFYKYGDDVNTGIQLEVDDNNAVYCSDNKAIYSKDKKRFIRLVSCDLKSYSIAEGTEVICENAFANCKLLEEIIIPESLHTIEKDAFTQCVSLTIINGIENVRDIDENSFSRQYKSIPYINNKSILILGTNLVKYSDYSTKTLIIPDGITKIWSGALGSEDANDIVEEIVLPDSVEKIGSFAFSGRHHLKKINIPSKTKIIGAGAFRYCWDLEYLFLPASIEIIDNNTYPFPTTYKDINKNVHESHFKWIEVDPNNRYFSSLNGILYSGNYAELLYIPKTRTLNIKKIISTPDYNCYQFDCFDFSNQEMEIPSSVKSFSDSCFASCSELKSISIPHDLELICDNALSPCKKLKKIAWSKNLKHIGKYAFKGCTIKELILPDGIETIDDEAFADSSIQTIVIPKTVKTIGWDICSGIEDIVIYDSIDPNAKDAKAAIDYLNGNPNSMVGYIGIGDAWAMRTCAANHKILDYTITVRSAETEDIKYKVWMGADKSQREYYCFLTSAWGHNATFAFDILDEFFPRIRGKEHKLKVAQYRLEYPVDLSDEAKKKYESYLKRYSDKK